MIIEPLVVGHEAATKLKICSLRIFTWLASPPFSCLRIRRIEDG